MLASFPTFREDTREIREAEWTVGEIPRDLRDRRVEITGPTNAKMLINALNSGAKVFMADFEDATRPAWDELLRARSTCATIGTTGSITPIPTAARIMRSATIPRC